MPREHGRHVPFAQHARRLSRDAKGADVSRTGSVASQRQRTSTRRCCTRASGAGASLARTRRRARREAASACHRAGGTDNNRRHSERHACNALCAVSMDSEGGGEELVPFPLTDRR